MRQPRPESEGTEDMRATQARCSEDMASLIILVAAFVLDGGWSKAEATGFVPRCDPSRHICEGRCPGMPRDAEPTDPERGVCLGDAQTGACVCWLLPSPSGRPPRHLQTLFTCQESMANGTVRHVMCLPPAVCFPSDSALGCLIVPHCPCAGRPKEGLRWHPVAALLLRSNAPVVEEESSSHSPSEEHEEHEKKEEAREFAPRHLLFLLAFVVAPLLCWCLLTFFNGSRCRLGKRRRMRDSAAGAEPEEGEGELLPTERTRSGLPEGEASCLGGVPATPSAPPKPMDSPPPYEAPTDGSLFASDCAPPPSYEDAVRHPRWPEEMVV